MGIDVVTSNYDEMYTFLLCTKIVKSIQLQQIIIFRNSFLVIKHIKGKKIKERNIQCKNYECIDWNLQSLDDVKLMHLMHINNSVADQLSNDAIKLDKGIIV